jgi:cytochrome P450
MSAIARAQVDGELLADEFLDGSWLLIVFAGNDTTRNTISGALKLLTEFPAEKARLIADPTLLRNAADEFIRMVSPVIYMRRTATVDTEIAARGSAPARR